MCSREGIVGVAKQPRANIMLCIRTPWTCMENFSKKQALILTSPCRQVNFNAHSKYHEQLSQAPVNNTSQINFSRAIRLPSPATASSSHLNECQMRQGQCSWTRPFNFQMGSSIKFEHKQAMYKGPEHPAGDTF